MRRYNLPVKLDETGDQQPEDTPSTETHSNIQVSLARVREIKATAEDTSELLYPKHMSFDQRSTAELQHYRARL
jgi:hypothetical protein